MDGLRNKNSNNGEKRWPSFAAEDQGKRLLLYTEQGVQVGRLCQGTSCPSYFNRLSSFLRLSSITFLLQENKANHNVTLAQTASQQ